MPFARPRSVSIHGLASSLVFCAALSAAPAAGRSPERAPSFGTTDRIQYHIAFDEFFPEDSSMGYKYFESGSFRGRGPLTPGGLTAPIHLPSGARLVSVELDSCDPEAAAHIQMRLNDCDYLGGDCHTLDIINTDGSGCGFVVHDISATPYTVNNNVRQLGLTVEMFTTQRILGAYIGYTLQVSPAPAVATFTDVPTNSPQFKFVEALVAAGITAGCGGGNYCPDNPITRGQMAVFLAAALGLHFPN